MARLGTKGWEILAYIPDDSDMSQSESYCLKSIGLLGREWLYTVD